MGTHGDRRSSEEVGYTLSADEATRIDEEIVDLMLLPADVGEQGQGHSCITLTISSI